jgi:WD40 repeat protein
VTAVAVGERDGRPVIISGGNDNTVRVWDLQTGEPALGPLTGHNGTVDAVAVGVRHGRPVIVSGSGDKTVRVWDLQTGEPTLGPLTGHNGTVSAVAVGERDGRPVIISGSYDQTVQVWNLESELHDTLRIELQHQVMSVASAADRLVLGTTAGLLRVDLL